MQNISKFFTIALLLSVSLSAGMSIIGCGNTFDGYKTVDVGPAPSMSISPDPTSSPALYNNVSPKFSIPVGGDEYELDSDVKYVRVCGYNSQGTELYNQKITKGTNSSYGSFELGGSQATLECIGVSSYINSFNFGYYDSSDKCIGFSLMSASLGDEKNPNLTIHTVYKPTSKALQGAAKLQATPVYSNIKVGESTIVEVNLEAIGYIGSEESPIYQNVSLNELISLESKNPTILEQSKSIANYFTGKSIGKASVDVKLQGLLSSTATIDVKE